MKIKLKVALYILNKLDISSAPQLQFTLFCELLVGYNAYGITNNIQCVVYGFVRTWDK